MNTPASLQPIIAPAIPWYRSPVVIAQASSMISGLVALAPKSSLVASLGLSDPTAVSADVTLVFGVIASLAQLVALIARARSGIQPVTFTQLGADLHANTLTVQASQKPPEVKP